MKTTFELKTTLSEIVSQLQNGEGFLVEKKTNEGNTTIEYKWIDEDFGCSMEAIQNPGYSSAAIIITTSWSGFSYTIFEELKKTEDGFTATGRLMCEYEGAFAGLLRQNILPSLVKTKAVINDDCQVKSSDIGCVSLGTYKKYHGRLQELKKQFFN